MMGGDSVDRRRFCHPIPANLRCMGACHVTFALKLDPSLKLGKERLRCSAPLLLSWEKGLGDESLQR